MASSYTSYENSTPPDIPAPFTNPASAPATSHQASSSTNPPSSYYHQQQPHDYRSTLPPPLPTDSQPTSKIKPTHHQAREHHQKFKLLRKGKEKERRQDSNEGTGDDDGWMIEGRPSAESVPQYGYTPSAGRRSVDVYRPPELENGASHDITQTMEVLAQEGSDREKEKDKKEKRSKGRGIVKKTSRLFGRDKDKSPEVDAFTSVNGGARPNGISSLGTTPGSRQTSYSSAHSSDSQVTTSGSIRSHNHLPSLTRPISHQSRNRSPLERQSHSRRASQDSTSSWRAPSHSVRSGSSPLHDSSNDVGVPIPSRQGSHMSASVPGLSRHALPQPGPSQPSSVTARSPDNFPSRMSTWFSHLLPSSSTATIQEGSIPSPPPTETSPHLPPSPLRKPPSAAASFLNAARQRAVDGVRHLLDSEAQPDKCPDPIWVMGVGHPGWRPSTPNRSPGTSFLPDLSDAVPHAEERRGSGSSTGRPSPPSKHDAGGLRPSAWSRKQKEQYGGPIAGEASTPPPAKGFSNLFTASTLSLALPTSMASGSPSKESEKKGLTDSPGKGKKDKKEKEVLRWPDEFYTDFRSRIWCTYRSQYAPILSIPDNLLIPAPQASLPSRPSQAGWSWSRPAEERGLTSDAGWGCMLRTGQSVLANALIHLHLGRDWRLPLDKPSSSPTNRVELTDLQNYAEYVKILSWFLDDPSPLCPFSVHRMALIGKELGKEVGEWFGPSTAAGALKTLTNAFAPCGLAVATATDSIIYRSDVYVASNLPSEGWDGRPDAPKPRKSSSSTTKSTTWGEKAVLILIGIRLGLDGVNPIYYDSIKALFTFPQSVGIAGGRPSSSYYFVGSQANSLFYLDPHFTRPAIPLEIPPAPTAAVSSPHSPSGGTTQDAPEEDPVVVDPLEASAEHSSGPTYALDVVHVDDISSQSESEGESNISSSPSTRVRRPRRTSKAAKRLIAKGVTPPRPRPAAPVRAPSPPAELTQHDAFSPASPSTSAPTTHNPLDPLPVDPSVKWYANAYPEAALRTFHCEKVKKMPLSGLDPSMLLGFLVKDEADWDDFVDRANKLPHKIFTIQDEPPSWDVDSDVGFESVSSEPEYGPEANADVDEPPLDDEEIEGVPVQSSRQNTTKASRSNGRNDGDEEEEQTTALGYSQSTVDEKRISTSTTVPAIDIAQRADSLKIGDQDDESWVEESGGTPASQRPVLVERPTEPPSPIPVRQEKAAWPLPSDITTSPTDYITTSMRANEKAYEFGITAQTEHEHDQVAPTLWPIRPHPAPVPHRMRTESWVDPGSGGEEAPNGMSML
ncbi:hypothetical protein I317_01007 [Kwoniella heveanensis CBS 569]|nr:hypothetical protein I317_01007 [Kwoniella heveanensis CBS 569]